MVVVAVVGILAAIAYPSYTDSVRKSRRADGRSALLAASQAMERFYTENASYSGPTLGASSTIGNTVSPEGFYSIAFDASPTGATVCGSTNASSANTSAYRICATPGGSQGSDSCGTLSVSSTGVKTPATSGCW